MGAEKIAPHGAVRRPRPDLDRMGNQLLPVADLGSSRSEHRAKLTGLSYA